MMQANALTVFSLLLLTTFGGAAIAAEQHLSCEGQMIDRTGQQTVPIALNLDLGGPGNTTIEVDGNKKLNTHVISDNQIQLKFQMKQYVGELFHYTGDLFLIYKSGHLARLTCSHG
jgi:hypothetical protein